MQLSKLLKEMKSFGELAISEMAAIHINSSKSLYILIAQSGCIGPFHLTHAPPPPPLRVSIRTYPLRIKKIKSQYISLFPPPPPPEKGPFCSKMTEAACLTPSEITPTHSPRKPPQQGEHISNGMVHYTFRAKFKKL